MRSIEAKNIQRQMRKDRNERGENMVQYSEREQATTLRSIHGRNIRGKLTRLSGRRRGGGLRGVLTRNQMTAFLTPALIQYHPRSEA